MGAELQATKVGKYDVLSKLGEGGMGVVYKAKDPLIDRVVAIKKMTGTFAEDAEARERFLREARAVGRLQHANIVTIYELGVEGNSPYMVMEYIEGKGLDKVLAERQALTLLQKLDYMAQICNALHYAHQHDIVHRDVKPANVIVMTGGHQVKLVDFGIARAGTSGMTRTGIAIGTTSYMSPEQIEADKGLDRRSDVFSAGVMMYEILTHSLPFPGSEPLAIAIKILREPYPPLSAFLTDYPPELDNILARALAKDREERYTTAEEFALDLNQLMERLRREQVGEYFADARAAFARFELARARDLLSQVIKVEAQNTEARQLLHEVQQLILKQERAAQVRDFRFAAEQAVGQDRFEDALGLIEQAIRLDKTNQQLLDYRELIQQGLRRKEEIRQKLQLADSAERTEDLKTAQDMVEKALEVDPTNTQARMMMAALKRRLGEHSREVELGQLAELAKREIKSHRFTAAHDVIRRMESIDPTFAEIPTLKEAAVAEHTRHEAQQKFVEEHLSSSNRLVAEGQLKQALSLLEEGVKQYPQESRMQAAITAVQAQIEEAAKMPPPPPRPAKRPEATKPMVAAPRAAGAAAAAAPAPAAAARRAPVVAPPEKSSKMVVIAVVVAVLVIGGGIGGYFAFRPHPATTAVSTGASGAAGTAAAGPSSLQITAIPFGMVKSVVDSKGNAVALPSEDRETPLRVEVPAGDYEIVVVGPDGTAEKTSKVTVQAGQPKFLNVEFKQVDAKKIVDSY